MFLDSSYISTAPTLIVDSPNPFYYYVDSFIGSDSCVCLYNKTEELWMFYSA